MVLTMKRCKAGLVLLVMMLAGLCGGCAATRSALAEESRAAVLELKMDPAPMGINPLVSGGEADDESQYPTTVLVESEAAPGFHGRPGSAGVCSGVLIAKDLVLTAGHCLCSQPMHSAVNKALNRVDCATRAVVKQDVRKEERSSEGEIERTITTYPKVQGVAFLPEEFRVDLDEQSRIRSISPDMAVIRLEHPINIELDHEPSDRELRTNDRITVVGFGSILVDGRKHEQPGAFLQRDSERP